MHSSQQTQDIIELTELVEVPTSDGAMVVQSQTDMQYDTAMQPEVLSATNSDVHTESSTMPLHSDTPVVSDSIQNPDYVRSTHDDVPTEDVTNDILVKLDNLDAIIKPSLSHPLPKNHDHSVSSLESIQTQCDALQTELHACMASVQKASDHIYTFESKLMKLQSRIDMLEHQLENYASFSKRINEIEIVLQSIQTHNTQLTHSISDVSSTDESITTIKELIAILEQRCVLLENQIDSAKLIDRILPKITEALQPTVEHGALLAASRIIKEELQALLEEE